MARRKVSEFDLGLSCTSYIKMRKIMSAANGNACAVAVFPLRALSVRNMCGESVRFVSGCAYTSDGGCVWWRVLRRVMSDTACTHLNGAFSYISRI